MRYISDDGKVFNTEQECCEYEQQIIQEKANRERVEKEKQNKLNVISKKYEELQSLICEFEKEFGVNRKPYFAPAYELLNMLRM